MSLETGLYVGDLVAANPPGTDPKSQGDDHLRLIKTALRNCFAGFVGAILVTGSDGGAANAYTVSPTTPEPAYSPRMIVLFSPTVANTGSSTLNISALGPKAILSTSGAPLVANDLVPGSIYAAAYDGTAFRLLSITKQYVDNLSFGSAVPAAPNDGNLYYLQSLNGSFFWGRSTFPDFVLFPLGVD